jgi:hypothetical protein
MFVQGLVSNFSYATDLSQEIELKFRLAPKLNELFNSLKEGKISCLSGSFLKFVAKLHPNLTKEIYNQLKTNENKGYALLGYIALLFKNMKIDIEFDPSNNIEFSNMMTTFGIPTEMIGMLPSMLGPMIEGMGLKEILSLMDGSLSIMLGTSKAVAEIGLDINGINELLSVF